MSNNNKIYRSSPPIERISYLSTCAKLKQGQLLMQRYKYTYDRFKDDARYVHIATTGKEKSIVLAGRMRDHADKCSRCSQSDSNFYGLDTWG